MENRAETESPERVPRGAWFSAHTGQFLSFQPELRIPRFSTMMLSETSRTEERHQGSNLRAVGKYPLTFFFNVKFKFTYHSGLAGYSRLKKISPNSHGFPQVGFVSCSCLSSMRSGGGVVSLIGIPRWYLRDPGCFLLQHMTWALCFQARPEEGSRDTTCSSWLHITWISISGISISHVTSLARGLGDGGPRMDAW